MGRELEFLLVREELGDQLPQHPHLLKVYHLRVAFLEGRMDLLHIKQVFRKQR